MNLILCILAATIGSMPPTLSMPGNEEQDSLLVRPFADSGLQIEPAASFPLATARVVVVSHLGAEGPGSLREALQGSGARLVVFAVGGVIDLAGASLVIREPYAFIAGETAPAPGITLIRGGLRVEAAHVVVRHLAIRPGDGRPRSDEPWEPDAITIARGHDPVHDVLIENCSATWAVDENASVSGPRDVRPAAGPEATAHRVTFRNNLIGEALLHSTHSKGAHSMGLLIHDGIREITIEGNLFAHNRERNPRLKGGVEAVVQGNVIYNWGSAAISMGAKGNEEVLEGARAIVRDNVALAGPDTKGRVLVKSMDPGAQVDEGGNLGRDFKGESLTLKDAGLAPMPEPLPWHPPPPPHATSASVLVSVLRGAGARPAQRDPIDRRIVSTVIDGTGRIIDSQSEVGGYPARAETRRPVVVPATGSLREAWLRGLMADLAADSSVDVSPLLKRLGLPR